MRQVVLRGRPAPIAGSMTRAISCERVGRRHLAAPTSMGFEDFDIAAGLGAPPLADRLPAACRPHAKDSPMRGLGASPDRGQRRVDHPADVCRESLFAACVCGLQR